VLVDGGDSAGLLVSATGTIGDVLVGPAACKAGLGPDERSPSMAEGFQKLF
jgi:hypothetical protein